MITTRSRRIDIALALVALVGCSAPHAQPPVANATISAQPVSINEGDAVVLAVLQRYVTDEKTLADAGLLPKTGPIYVLAKVDEKPVFVMTSAALPTASPRPFVTKTLVELQHEADRTAKTVAFIRFFRIEIDGNDATVVVGVDILLPANSQAIKLCCCSDGVTYKKHGGAWVFFSRTMTACG